MSGTSDYKKEIMDAAHNERIRLALTRAIARYRTNVDNALKKFPHTLKLAEEVREIKSRSLREMENLANQAKESVEENHGKAYIARTVKEALDIIGNLTGTGKLVVKGKSM